MEPKTKLNLIQGSVENYYHNEIRSANPAQYVHLPELLKRIETEENSINLKEQFLNTFQLYFDGLIPRNKTIMQTITRKEPERNSETWAEQKQALSALITAGKQLTKEFYEGNGVSGDEISSIIMPYEKTIIKYGSQDTPKVRHLLKDYDLIRDAAEFMQELSPLPKNKGLITGIASGGIEPALLATTATGIDDLLLLRFSRYSSRKHRWDSTVKAPMHAPEEYLESTIKNKQVLLVDDEVHSRNARSMKKTTKYLARKGAESVFGIAVKRNEDSCPPRASIIHERNPFFFLAYTRPAKNL